ncbi:MAG: hypothetical protein JXA15_04910 [Spirochaetales bacterium]|nr:hypothetical protein [Spirochaetales bacterium]
MQSKSGKPSARQQVVPHKGSPAWGSPTPLKVALLVIVSIGLGGFAAWVLLDSTQSSFSLAERGEIAVLVEKTASDGFNARRGLDLLDEAARWIESATGWRPLSDGRRFTAIMTAGSFASLAPPDPLVTERFSGADSPARLPLKRFARNMRGGEIAFPVFPSPDGNYAVLDLESGPALPSMVHALVHAEASFRKPQAVKALTDPFSDRFDPAETARWRFVEETVAVLLSELAALGGSPAEAAGSFDRAAARYAADGPVRDEERLRLALTGTVEEKDGDYYLSAYEFAARLLAVAGARETLAFCARVVSGDYDSLEGAFARMRGGFGPVDVDSALGY